MNKLLLIVPSNLKNKNDVIRFAESVDYSSNIHVYFINQSDNQCINEVYEFKKCRVTEITTGKIVPLSIARNIALKIIYKKEHDILNTLVMFPDDDAWFPQDTLQFLLDCDNKAYAIKTLDPLLNKSFNKVKNQAQTVEGWHVIKDICSICIVIPLQELLKEKLLFNEKLGLGNEISQGEESLFIFYLYKHGMKIYNDVHLIYHPYKNSNSLKNYYSMSYFWSMGLTHLSAVFFLPCVKYLCKYTIALLLSYRGKKYWNIFKAVWKGALDGKRDIKKILENNHAEHFDY